MDKKFTDMIQEAVNTSNIDRNLDALDDLSYRLVKLLRPDSVVVKQILTVDPGFKKDVSDLERIAKDLANRIEDLVGDVQKSNR